MGFQDLWYDILMSSLVIVPALVLRYRVEKQTNRHINATKRDPTHVTAVDVGK